MALSKHTAAGAQGKGDRSSWGAQGGTGDSRGGAGGLGGDEQLQPRAPVPPPCHHFQLQQSQTPDCVCGFCFCFVFFIVPEQSCDFVPRPTIVRHKTAQFLS